MHPSLFNECIFAKLDLLNAFPVPCLSTFEKYKGRTERDIVNDLRFGPPHNVTHLLSCAKQIHPRPLVHRRGTYLPPAECNTLRTNSADTPDSLLGMLRSLRRISLGSPAGSFHTPRNCLPRARIRGVPPIFHGLCSRKGKQTAMSKGSCISVSHTPAVPTGTSKTKSASFRTSLRQRFVISRGQAKR